MELPRNTVKEPGNLLRIEGNAAKRSKKTMFFTAYTRELPRNAVKKSDNLLLIEWGCLETQ